MDAMPTLCPTCGELIVVRPCPDSRALIIPRHPDRVTPFVECLASARQLQDGKIRQR